MIKICKFIKATSSPSELMAFTHFFVVFFLSRMPIFDTSSCVHFEIYLSEHCTLYQFMRIKSLSLVLLYSLIHTYILCKMCSTVFKLRYVLKNSGIHDQCHLGFHNPGFQTHIATLDL